MCVRGIDVASLYDLSTGTLPTVWTGILLFVFHFMK
jgi:hypothetical protein